MKTDTDNKPINIQLSPTAKATYVKAEHSCGFVRVTGWIHADDQKSGLAGSDLLGGLFEKGKCAGGFSLDGTFTEYPFSFDLRPTVFNKRLWRLEDKEELMERVQRTLRNAQRNLTRTRNDTLKKLEAGAFEYVKA